VININASNLNQNLSGYLNQAVQYRDVININTANGNAILLSEEDYKGLMETLYLLSVPGMKERLEDGLNVRPEDCDEFEW